MKNQLLFIHPSVDLYGSDKILLEILNSLYEYYNIILLIPKEGELTHYIRNNFPNIKIELITELPIIARKNLTLSGICKFIRNLLLFNRIIKKLNLDERTIIYCNTLATTMCLFFFAPFYKIIHVHEISPNNKLIYKLINHIALKRADRIISVSDAVSSNLKQVDSQNNKIITLYNGIRAGKEVNYKEDIFTFSLVGRLKPEIKGQYIAIEATKILKSNIDIPFRVLFWGTPVTGQEYMKKEIEQKLTEYKLQDYIKLMGFTTDLNLIYSNTTISLIPSIKPDSLPTTALESFSHGIPIIGSNIGGIPEIIDDGINGFLISPGNSMALANYMKFFLLNQSKVKDMGRAAKEKYNELFSQELFSQRIRTIINESCNHRNGRSSR